MAGGANAPSAIWNLFGLITVLTKQMSGIVGNVAHSFGYHLARNDLPGDDYSVELARDHGGDGSNASALDVHFDPPHMILVTKRLLAAAKAHDPRLAGLRSFCGTTDGYNTHPYDLATGQDGPLNSWDSSHLTHIHMSFFRDVANNAAALAPIADVINGVPITPKDAPMSKAELATIQAQIHSLNLQLAERIERVHAGVTLTVHGDKTHPNGQDQTGPIIRQLAADVAALKAAQAPPVPPVTPAKK